MWEIDLHFTGDLHAITSAHNLLSAVLDNHLAQGNALRIDPSEIRWRRVMDMNDRFLRNMVGGMGGRVQGGLVRETGFDITAASEIMAIMALSESIADLKKKLGNILVALRTDGTPVFARDLGCTGAMAVLLRDALNPNLVQTLEGAPVFIHCGPFANIAHGNNSIVATRMALALADYVVTEGGFASDLGAEKFFDIVCPVSGLSPSCAVLVCSLKALKMHGGCPYDTIKSPNQEALKKGMDNLDHHIKNLAQFGLPVVVAVNRFPGDTDEELAMVIAHCQKQGARAAVSEVFARGGEGGVELARKVLEAMEGGNSFQPLVNHTMSAREKIEMIATRVYGAEGVVYEPQALKDLALFDRIGLANLPICMAKTQLSISDDPTLLNVPRGWTLKIREVRASAGAGFLVPIAGKMLLMPGLPAIPSALSMDVLDDGTIIGLN